MIIIGVSAIKDWCIHPFPKQYACVPYTIYVSIHAVLVWQLNEIDISLKTMHEVESAMALYSFS